MLRLQNPSETLVATRERHECNEESRNHQINPESGECAGPKVFQQQHGREEVAAHGHRMRENGDNLPKAGGMRNRIV